MATTLHDLELRARAGDSTAQLAMGDQAEGRGDNQVARAWFAQAAKTGRSDALRKLAINLLMQEPVAVEHGTGMIRGAAERGDAPAAHMCALLAANDHLLDDRWNIALGYLQRAAEGGHALAQAQLRLLSSTKDQAASWATLRGAIDIAQWLSPPPARSLCASPKLSAIDGFLPDALCGWLIARARARIEPATVNLPNTGEGRQMSNIRTNSHAGFPLEARDLVMVVIKARMVAATGLSAEGFEPPMVLHYAVGEEYKPHFDFFDLGAQGLAQEVTRAGQRVATFLVYLNDDFEGGETDFPRLDIRYRGKKGDGLLFFNVDDDAKADPRTLHAGLAPRRGEKWLFSQWIRRQPPVTRP